MNPHARKTVCRVIYFAWVINFAVFVFVAIVLGGAAASPPAKDGRYYLDFRGDFTEVSRATYTYSRVHRDSLWISIPLVMLAMIVAWRIERKERNSKPN